MAKQNIFGLLFDPKTGKVTFEDGEIPAVGGDFTFEEHNGYNPLQYATEKTCEKLIVLLKSYFGAQYTYETIETEVTGAIAPPVQKLIRISKNGIFGDFNAGLIANSIIRSGSLNSLSAAMKSSGLSF
jgi:hypothetical protein